MRRQTTTDAVLIVTASYDLAPSPVGATLGRNGVPFFRLDTDRFPSEIHASFDPRTGLTISDGDRVIRGDQIKSVWYRRNVAPLLPDSLDAGTQHFCERETRAFLEGALVSLPTDRWLSAPSAIWLAEHKPYQLAVASRLGFTIPPTIVTNNGQSALSFAQQRQSIAKAVSSGYIASPEGNKAIFTSAVSADDVKELGGLSLAPVIFQEKVEKTSDIRVTVVGEDVFAAEILSQCDESSRVDWRATHDPDLCHREHKLPSALANLCRDLVSHLGLHFGAIDFALTHDGKYVFFEINPNGEWLWLEERLGFPISDRIARWLSS